MPRFYRAEGIAWGGVRRGRANCIYFNDG
jgi:hypothetical protein